MDPALSFFPEVNGWPLLLQDVEENQNSGGNMDRAFLFIAFDSTLPQSWLGRAETTASINYS